MDTFKWKWWRFACLADPSWGVSTTVYDGSGRWRKVFGPLCILLDRADVIYKQRISSHDE